MATIVRRTPTEREFSTGLWDPFRLMREMLRFDPYREADVRSAAPAAATEASFTPRFDVKETKSAFVIKADLPGVNDEDVDVSVTGRQLTISGHREHERREDGDQFFAVERSSGRTGSTRTASPRASTTAS